MASRARSNSRNSRVVVPTYRRSATKARPSVPELRPAERPTWKEGYVDPRREHFELRYGERKAPLARVGRDPSQWVLVQFLVETRDGDARLNAVRGELTYYLFSVAGPNAWAFARFHCDTPANRTSSVHWRWQPGQ